MKLNKIFLFASASLLMTSCGLYNKYERPQVDTYGLVRVPYYIYNINPL